MKLKLGYIPYLNMVPFHQGFGPEPLKANPFELEFKEVSPRGLGLEAEAGRVDGGAMSLVDSFRLSHEFEPVSDFGIGVQQAAGSVLLFSKKPLAEFSGMCAVTDETATSVRLLEVLLEKRYERSGVHYGRIAAGSLYDDSADGLLLIGDEALRALEHGVKGLPVVTDLATEWFQWQQTPFVFARWMVRRGFPGAVPALLEKYLEKSLVDAISNLNELAVLESEKRGIRAAQISSYWENFRFRLTPDHMKSIETFQALVSPALETAGSQSNPQYA
jgi:chorismate dehydratase